MARNENKVNPLRITTKSGDTYVLEFTRETVKFAEDRRFNITELADYPQTNIPSLWFYAFRKNHRNISRAQTDKILFDDLGGLTKDEIERLVQLYNQPTESLLNFDGDARKNSGVLVEL